MSQPGNIKNWIIETKSGKMLQEDSILIQKNPEGGIKITLLDHACCRPQAVINKKLEDIEKEDIARIAHVINHVH